MRAKRQFQARVPVHRRTNALLDQGLAQPAGPQLHIGLLRSHTAEDALVRGNGAASAVEADPGSALASEELSSHR